MLQMPGYTAPNVTKELFCSAPDVSGESASAGFLPLDFYVATIFPAYFKIDENLPLPGWHHRINICKEGKLLI